MAFRIIALPAATYAPLFSLDADALARHRARRVVADAAPGFPCRVSLIDAQPGETLLLVHHLHQPTDSPFRAGHAI